MHEYFELAQKYGDWGSLHRACLQFVEAETIRNNNPQAERILEAWLHAQLPFLSESNAHVHLDVHQSLAHLFVSQENDTALENNCRKQLKLGDEFILSILKTLPGFAALAVLGQKPGGGDADERLLQSLPLESIGGTMTEPTPAARYWKRRKLRRESAERFRDETSGLPVTEQIAAVTQRLDEINPRIAHAKSFQHVVREGKVVEVTPGPFDEGFDLTPLMAFTKLEHLTVKSGSYVDLSSVKKTAIRHLICPESTVRLNAVALSETDGLETINGQPATEYLAGF